MGNETLQALSKQYARGEISKPEYRLQRQKIIDEATGIGGLYSPEPVNSMTSHSPGDEKPSSNMFFKAGVISAAIVVVIILAYVSF